MLAQRSTTRGRMSWSRCLKF